MNTRAPSPRPAIRLGPETKAIELRDNQIRGYASEVQPAK